MRRKPNTKVEVTPPMPKGETEFEEKRIQCEYTLIHTRIMKSDWPSFSAAVEYAFRAGYETGKAKERREKEQ
jgi:hypothetical protein